jgi:hypothetical protein
MLHAAVAAGYVAGEVAPLLQAELAASLGPWLADSSNSLKRLDTRLAVSNPGGGLCYSPRPA